MSKTCIRCKHTSNDNDNFCANCGMSFKPHTSFIFSHAGIILMIFLLGPFAWPFVFTSNIISKPAKWAYSLLLTLYTVGLVYYCYKIYLVMAETLPSLLNMNI